MTTFAELGLAAPLVEALSALGYEEPTPIQSAAIPPLLAGRDLLGQAATGTGKTAAFALPLLQRLPAEAPAASRPRLLVLVPTRELAIQVAEAFSKYGKPFGAGVVPIYGGQAFADQIRTLRRGVQVVVATPGRALDHLRRKTLDFADLVGVVLDEADEMLDMGFAEELEQILAALPETRQTALFSATLPPRIAAIAERHLRQPVRVLIARQPAAPGSLPKVRQVAYVVARPHRVAALGRLLDLEAPTLALIFCRTRTEVDELHETLAGRGFRAEALHGGMSQEARDRVMKRTRSGGVDLLIATDVAARGLDIEQLSHVINIGVPDSPATYVHRIGRTGRAGREGVAITVAEPREQRLLRNIEAVTRQPVALQPLPSVADVRARRLARTTGALGELLAAGGGEARFDQAIAALVGTHDLRTVATAALALAHRLGAGAGEDREEEIPEAAPKRASGERGPVRERSAGGPAERGVRIYIGAGRKQNIRPADLVGAIVNEAGVEAKRIGAIEIGDRFSLVEVAEPVVDQVIAALRAGTIKGKKQTVRRDLAGRQRGDDGPPRRGDSRPR